MSIQYAPSRINTTFVATTKALLMSSLETALLSAGWTTISGSGTTNLLMQSVATPAPQNLQMRLRVKDNAGTCVTLTIENVAGTKAATSSTTQGAQLLPGARTWRLVANPYQAAIFTPTVTANREFAMWGVFALPTHLQGVITEGIWMTALSSADTDVTARPSMRIHLTSALSNNGSNGCSLSHSIINGNLLQINHPDGGQAASVFFYPPSSSQTPTGTLGGFRWHDDSALVFDAILCMGLSAFADEAKARGLMWDAFLSSEAYTADLTTSYDSHSWIVVTDNNTGVSASRPRGTLFLCTA